MLRMMEAPVQCLWDAQPPAPHEGAFTIVTFNVWFDKRHQRVRYDALFRLLEERRPDVIAFQEVTYEFLRRLKGERWTEAYRWVDDHAAQLGHYGVAILASLPILRASYAELPSDMGRTILCAELDLGREVFTVATTHLESWNENEERRAQQLDAIGELLSQRGAGVLCGDLNFCASWQTENDRLAAYADVWADLRPGERGYTLDPTINRMKEGGSLAPVRFDRMLLFGERRWRAETIDLFATECLPGQPKVWPSDHFGLIASLIGGGV